MMNNSDQQFDRQLAQDQNESSEALAPMREPVDITPIANASASVFNGPNGAEFCKTLRHSAYVAGGVAGFKFLLDFFAQMRTAA